MRAVAEKKRRYRRLLLIVLALALLGSGIYGYWYLEKSVPDKIYVTDDSENRLDHITDNPLITFSDDMEVFSRNCYQVKCSILGAIPLKTVQVQETERPVVQVCGAPVGIYMETEGVLIIDAGEIKTIDGQMISPAEHIVKPGDYIQKVDGKPLENKKQLIDHVAENQGEPMVLEVMRQGENVELKLDPVQANDGSYKLGIWVRDNIQGIGTLTYVDEDGGFGALGHGISDVDVGEILKVGTGQLYQADILSVVRGQNSSPGELQGVIHYYPEELLGTIEDNSKVGIYGHLSEEAVAALPLQTMEVGRKQEIEIGPASVLCSVDGRVQEYDMEITQINWNQQDTNKCFMIQVTDLELLEKTGGIVQGMSGSPIIQNGKLIGAVTHVLVNDPTRGYGIFIENMLDAAG